MSRHSSHLGSFLRACRWAGLAAILGAVLGLSGCRTPLFGERDHPFDPSPEWGRPANAKDRNFEFWSLTNEGREIERDFQR
jgi:hypothetical protein